MNLIKLTSNVLRRAGFWYHRKELYFSVNFFQQHTTLILCNGRSMFICGDLATQFPQGELSLGVFTAILSQAKGWILS